jgi:hypothetical protein
MHPKPMRAGRCFRSSGPVVIVDVDRWIRWTTIACVGLLALIAGTVSFRPTGATAGSAMNGCRRRLR